MGCESNPHYCPLSRSLCWIATVVILVVTFTRIVAVDRSRPQGFDEPAHIAAGMEWLQFGTYHLDSLHPPLARVAIAAPLYFAGSRFPESNSASLPQFWDAGNSIIYQNHNYLHNLFLARMGGLVFFAILLGVVFFWTRRLFGDVAALASVILLSTLPVVLTFASLAYTRFARGLFAGCVRVGVQFVANKTNFSDSCSTGGSLRSGNPRQVYVVALYTRGCAWNLCLQAAG